MSVSTYFFFDNRVKPTEIANVIAIELGVQADLSDIKHEHAKFDGDFERHHGYIRFVYKGFFYSLFFYPYNHISGGERDGTNSDTLSAHCCPENQQILELIGQYFGGVLNRNGSNEHYEYIQNTKNHDNTPYQELINLVCTELGYKSMTNVVDFIRKHHKFIAKVFD